MEFISGISLLYAFRLPSSRQFTASTVRGRAVGWNRIDIVLIVERPFLALKDRLASRFRVGVDVAQVRRTIPDNVIT
jgi:hypothetical protein